MVSIDPSQLGWGEPPDCTDDALGGWLKSRTPGVPQLTTRLLLLHVYFAVSSAEMKALKERGPLGIIGAHITSIVKNKVRRPGASSYYPNHPYTRAGMRAASSFICAYAHSRSHTGPSAVQVTPHMECWMGSGQAHRAHRERGSTGRHAVYVGSGRNYDARSDA